MCERQKTYRCEVQNGELLQEGTEETGRAEEEKIGLAGFLSSLCLLL